MPKPILEQRDEDWDNDCGEDFHRENVIYKLGISQAHLQEQVKTLASDLSSLIKKIDSVVDIVAQHETQITIFATEKKMWKMFSKPIFIGMLVIIALASGFKLNDVFRWLVAP